MSTLGIRSQVLRVGLVAAHLFLGLAPSFALDPVPKGMKERQRHEFRDVQRGLHHDPKTGKSEPTLKPADAPSKSFAPSFPGK